MIITRTATTSRLVDPELFEASQWFDPERGALTLPEPLTDELLDAMAKESPRLLLGLVTSKLLPIGFVRALAAIRRVHGDAFELRQMTRQQRQALEPPRRRFPGAP